MINKKNINTNDWNLEIFGGLSKNQIRNISKGLFGSYLIFATLEDCNELDYENILLTINLANVNINKLNTLMGENFAKELSIKSNTYTFKFKTFTSTEKIVDLHGYEPSKISIGTYSKIIDVYIILEGKLI